MRRSLDRGRTRSSDDHHARRMHAGAGPTPPSTSTASISTRAPIPTPTPTAIPTPPAKPADMARTDDIGAKAAAEYFMGLFAYTTRER